MGYFIDVDEEMSRVDNLYKTKRIDPVTELMNSPAMREALADYASMHEETGQNYGLILLNNEKYERIKSDYGEEFSNALLKKMGQEIVEITGASCAVARTIDSTFALLTYISDKSELEFIAKQAKEKLEAIKDLDGNSVTVKIKMGLNLRTDEGITDENMYQMVLQSMT
jgi:GGDEF domain-containing protein